MEEVAVEEMMQSHTDIDILPYYPFGAVRPQKDSKQDDAYGYEPYHPTTLLIFLLCSAISLLMMRVAYTFDT